MFSVEEELLFAVRYEEGYDLFDPRYEAWLKVNHSETKTQSSASIVPPSAGSVLVPDSSKPLCVLLSLIYLICHRSSRHQRQEVLAF